MDNHSIAVIFEITEHFHHISTSLEIEHFLCQKSCIEA